MTHLGRPEGRKEDACSLGPVATKLSELLGREVTFLDDCFGEEVERKCNEASGGAVILLENLRFHLEETGKGLSESGDKVKASEVDVEAFRASLSKLGDIFVNDAFGTSHRAHSSVVGVSLKTRCAGFVVKQELESFGKLLGSPERPFLAIMGGAKLSGKLQLLLNMLDHVDSMVIVGGIAYAFKRAVDGMATGASFVDDEDERIVAAVMDKARTKRVAMHLPTDFVCGETGAPSSDRWQRAEHRSVTHLAARPVASHSTLNCLVFPCRFRIHAGNDATGADIATRVVTDKEGIPDGWTGLDIGPVSAQAFAALIGGAASVFFNDPPGMFQMPDFTNGTKVMMEATIAAAKAGTFTVIGGGGAAAASIKYGAAAFVNHVSTGGGAAEEMLEGKTLPGVAALSDA